MKLLLLPLRIIYCTYAALLFVITMLLVFPVTLVASLWGKVKGGDLIYKTCRIWGDVWFFLIGIRHRNIFHAPLKVGQQYIFVANHISYLDIPVIFKSIRSHRIRVLGKFEMKRIPIFGFIYRNAVVMVDRSSTEARSKSVRQLKSVLAKGISIFLYPEGTFNETHQPLKDFYDGAFRIAIETQTPILPIIFLDTYDRMHYSGILTLNPGRSRSVFLNEVCVSGLTLKDLPMLRAKVFDQMQSALVQYHASWVNSSLRVKA